MKNKIFDLVRDLKRNLAGKRVLAAVSGGKDSVFMLYALSRAISNGLLVAHFNHKSRPSSDRDEMFVKNLCESLQVPFVRGELSRKPPRGCSLEEFYRTHRYEFFEKVKKEKNLDLICVAHNTNDIVETFLFRLFTGRLLKIPPRWSEDRKIFRPIYYWRSDQIISALRYLKLDYMEDESNFDSTFDRNYLRGILEELAKRFGSKLFNNVLERVETFNQSFESSQALSRVLARAIIEQGNELQAVRNVLSSLNQPSTQRIFMNEWIFANLGFHVGCTHLGRLLDFFTGHAQRLDLPQRITLVKVRGRVLVKN
ncbi:MAG: tRNA lysidine(34) synthetase TilS [Deltaproteobacteria bacterium]|nr:tRNA lysidine(34) synthetase TilS [Deltaproteobacteria bacterium]